jgi:hypothetical protein
MPSQSSRKRFLGGGLVAVLVGILSGLPGVASAAPKQEPPVSSHLISREHAEELIARFRATVAPGAVRAQSFHRSAFDALLAQPGAVGIRIYYGKYADGADTVVLYATDKKGLDLTRVPVNASSPCPPCSDSEAEADALQMGATASKQKPPASSHLVSRGHAEELIARFRATAAPGAARAQSFDRSAFDALLAQPGATGIRIHHGKHADGTDTVVLYATDKNGWDLTRMPMQNGLPCPPSCPDSDTEAGAHP